VWQDRDSSQQIRKAIVSDQKSLELRAHRESHLRKTVVTLKKAKEILEPTEAEEV
jgi:hypothetical protein